MSVMHARTWILGAPDPEMERIERLLRECGESVIYATNEPIHIGDATTVCTVDCDPPLAVGTGWDDPGAYYQPIRIGARWYPRAEADYMRRIVRIGRRCPPSDNLPSSAIGQVIAELARLSPCPLPAEWDTDYVPGLALGQYFHTQDGRYLVGTEDGPMYVPSDIVRAAAEETKMTQISDTGRDNLVSWLRHVLKAPDTADRMADELIAQLDLSDPEASVITEVPASKTRSGHPETYTFGADEIEVTS